MSSAVTKPAVLNPFANSASGSPDIAVPTYLETGYPAPSGDPALPVKPPRGYANWLHNYAMNGVRYHSSRGIPDWDAAETEYKAGSIVNNDGRYCWMLSGTATTGLRPSADTTNWTRLNFFEGALGDALGGGATSFDGSSNPTTWDDMLTNPGAPVSGLDVLPTFGAGSGYAVNVGAGAGFLSTSVGVGSEESSYRQLTWAGQSVTHGTPDATHDRIDAITATPVSFGVSTLAVVAGTPAATPLAPAIPSGSGAIFYVLVPAGAADATSFRACRGMWRRVGYPWAGMSAIISGGELSWDYTVDPSSTSAQIYFGAPDLPSSYSIHRLLIDGEPIEWAGFSVGGTGIVPDSTANPFGTDASADFDRPYYIYACGGRHSPLPSAGFGDNFLNPVTLCESTIAPNVRTGKPTGNLTVNGVTVSPNGAVYVGLGFVVAGSTRRRACVMDAEMTCALGPLQTISHAFTTTGVEDMGTFSAGSQPAISTKARINASFTAPTATSGGMAILLQDHVRFGGLDVLAIATEGAAKIALLCNATIEYAPRVGSELWGVLNLPEGGTADGASCKIGAMGFNHRVNRICVGF